MPIELGRLDQAHDGSRTLTGPELARKRPVVEANSNRPNLVFAPVVIDRRLRVFEVARQCLPTL